MAAFHSELAIRIVDDSAHGGSGRWRLTEPLTYYSDGFGMVVVPEGFETDMDSAPRWAIYGLYGNVAHKASVVHDWLLQEGQPRNAADKEFLAAMKASGVPPWRRWPRYLAVRAFSLFTGERNG